MIARDTRADVFARLDGMSEAELLGLIQSLGDNYAAFVPRPNKPSDWDEQTAFCEAFYSLDTSGPRAHFSYPNDERFWVCLGGTGSGKTQAAAWRVARHIREIPPPKPRTPFWIVGEQFDQICQIGWVEKLSLLIPPDTIHAIDWYRVNRRWPQSVMLKHPTRPGEVGWVLDFKSYAQGIGAAKGVSIGGYWCNEELPYHLVHEIQGRCRDYDSPGWADFTPVECRDPEWIDAYENPPAGWKFFHLNSLCNYALAPGFMERYLETVPEELRPMRTIGKFTVLSGAVFKEFRKSIHVIDEFPIPRDWRKVRGVDFGWNNPLAMVWCAKDREGTWYVYDEHYRAQTLLADHAKEISRREWHQGEPYYGPTYADTAGARECAELRNEHGIVTTPARKSRNPGLEFLRSLMLPGPNGRPRLQIFSKCKNLIREIQGYRYPEGTSGRNPGDEPMDKDDHSIDALRYALFSDAVTNQNASIGTMRLVPEHERKGVRFERRK